MNYTKGQVIDIDGKIYKCFCVDDEYAVFAAISLKSPHYERMSFGKGNVKVLANTGPMYFEIGAKSEPS